MEDRSGRRRVRLTGRLRRSPQSLVTAIGGDASEDDMPPLIDTDSEDEEEKDIVVDGIKYQLNCEDNIVLDQEDMEIMGTWNQEKQEIEFENDELREKHQSRIE